MILPVAAAVLAIASTSFQSGSDAPVRPVRFDERTIAKILTHSPLEAPPKNPTNAHADDPAAAHLGRFLFFEKRFSRNGEIACATCHDPARAFTDGKTLSEGLGTAARHAPTLLNVAWQRWLFLDGRADSLWAQARQPIENPVEMGGDGSRIVALVAQDAELRAGYESVFGPLPDVATRENADRLLAWTGKAIEAYERRLVSRDCAFDRFAEALRTADVEGQVKYPEAAQRGLALFVGRANCRLCHAGANFSDEEFHNIGVPTLDRSPPRDSGRYGAIEAVQKDPFNAAGPHSDDRQGPRARELDMLARTSELWGQFRTPSLREVARTAPYMHQGQFATLRDVLHYYSTLEGTVPAGHHGEQVIKPLHFSEQEIEDLLAFLETLNGAALPEELLGPPASPRGIEGK